MLEIFAYICGIPLLFLMFVGSYVIAFLLALWADYDEYKNGRYYIVRIRRK